MIIFGIFMLVAFTTGFYFGYLKREDKPPEMPFVEELTHAARKFTLKKKKEEPPKSFYD
jgi:hypothetical protein